MTTTNAAACATCHMPNVLNGREYVQDEGWRRAYPRGRHTPERCAERLASFVARVQDDIDHATAEQARITRGRRGVALIERYKAIFGEDAVSANWCRLNARWLA